MPREAYLAGDQADVEVAVRILEDNPAFAANNGDILQCVAEQLQKAELDRAELSENFDDARHRGRSDARRSAGREFRAVTSSPLVGSSAPLRLRN
jgi:hypothetical protein